MSQGINQLAKALRDAAASIENAAKFSVQDDVDLPEAVGLLRSVKRKGQDLILDIRLEIDDETETVEFQIMESYTTKAKSGTLQNCLEIYLASKEDHSSLASLSRLIKSAAKQEEKAETALAIAN